ncbi:hypothetical protein [Nitrososphaera sp.]|uniref:hypothetical protein n=1 Tax=Nitrososphaera sp. TaxID=1971748 RepID=UPI0017D8792F|nr:hypothetical protein [Nitrososphaera sp.]NWG36680.1 hypothetical protein [Nitrososphaera sp.]
MNTRLVAGGAVAAVVIYFALAVFFLPQPYLLTLVPPRPAPVITSVTLSNDTIALGGEFSIRVSAANRGDPADLQLVSIAFPNATSTAIATVNDHNFKQTPLPINRGDPIAASYTGIQNIEAGYPAIEAQSRPWEPGEAFNIDLSIKPEGEGRFVIFVKAVGLPHNGDQAHYPAGGILDQQNEYVDVYEVTVTKP